MKTEENLNKNYNNYKDLCDVKKTMENYIVM